jgi:hypothetical protein
MWRSWVRAVAVSNEKTIIGMCCFSGFCVGLVLFYQFLPISPIKWDSVQWHTFFLPPNVIPGFVWVPCWSLIFFVMFCRTLFKFYTRQMTNSFIFWAYRYNFLKERNGNESWIWMEDTKVKMKVEHDMTAWPYLISYSCTWCTCIVHFHLTSLKISNV